VRKVKRGEKGVLLTSRNLLKLLNFKSVNILRVRSYLAHAIAILSVCLSICHTRDPRYTVQCIEILRYDRAMFLVA